MSFKTKLLGLRKILQFDNWLWLIVTRTLFPSESLYIYRYRGIEILTDHESGVANSAREVLTSPMYKQFLPRMKLEGPLTVLDLGANNGGFPLMLKAEGLELDKEVSVELNPRTFVRLDFNLHRNLAGEIHAVNAAVCAGDRRLELNLGRGSVSDSIFGNDLATERQTLFDQGLFIRHDLQPIL